MNTLKIHMPFKGERNYLHGTSMYTESINELSRVLQGPLNGPFRMAIHKIARYSLHLLYSPISDSLKNPDEFIAEFSFFSGNHEYRAWLIETDIEVSDRIPYPEFKIEEKCIISKETVTLSDQTGLLPIEELIGMTKVLHIEEYPPLDFQWFFSRLDWKRLLDPDLSGKLKVSLEGILGNRYTRSIIKYGDENLGHIYFSRVTQ